MEQVKRLLHSLIVLKYQDTVTVDLKFIDYHYVMSLWKLKIILAKD